MGSRLNEHVQDVWNLKIALLAASAYEGDSSDEFVHDLVGLPELGQRVDFGEEVAAGGLSGPRQSGSAHWQRSAASWTVSLAICWSTFRTRIDAPPIGVDRLGGGRWFEDIAFRPRRPACV